MADDSERARRTSGTEALCLREFGVWRRGKLVWPPVTICACVVLVFLSFNVTMRVVRHCQRERHNTRYYDSDEHILNKRDSHRRLSEGDDVTDECVTPVPTSRDVADLCRGVDCATLYCRYSYSCDGESIEAKSRTTCFNKACNYFSVTLLKHDGKRIELHQNASIGQLASIINGQLDPRKPELQDIGKYLIVICREAKSFLFNKPFSVEIDFDSKISTCLTDSTEEAGNTRNYEDFKLYILYLRFTSRWESYVKFPRLNSLLEHARSDKFWRVQTLTTGQSLGMHAEENLRALLEGLVTSNFTGKLSSRDNILLQAQKSGICLEMNVLACKKSRILEEIEGYARSKDNAKMCGSADNNLRPLSSGNWSIQCEDEDDNPVEASLNVEETLNSVHNHSSERMLSLTYVNVLHLPSAYTLDSSVTRFVSKILSSSKNILYIVSDIGDPRFSRLDQSVFLKWQTFNPMLHLITPSHLTPVMSSLAAKSEPKYSSQKASPNFRLVTLLGVYESVKNFLSPHDSERANITTNNQTVTTSSTVDFENLTTAHGQIESDVPTDHSCPAVQIRGPVECTCLGRLVHFPNDSVQAGFASLVVGRINNKLLDLYRLNDDQTSDSRADRTSEEWRKRQKVRAIKNSRMCDRLVGVSFDNVRHALWGNATIVAMDLTLKTTTRLQNELIKISAEIAYEKIAHLTDARVGIKFIAPGPMDINDIGEPTYLARFYRHTLCKEPNSLSETEVSKQAFLRSLSPRRNHFGGHTETKSLHYPCLYAFTTRFRESSMLEIANICRDRSYRVSFAAELLDILSLSHLPADIELRAHEVRFLTSLVKSGYGLSQFAYNIKTTYSVTVHN